MELAGRVCDVVTNPANVSDAVRGILPEIAQGLWKNPFRRTNSEGRIPYSELRTPNSVLRTPNSELRIGSRPRVRRFFRIVNPASRRFSPIRSPTLSPARARTCPADHSRKHR